MDHAAGAGHGDGSETPGTQDLSAPAVPAPLALRWWQVFPGHERELSGLRRWLTWLLPHSPTLEDVLIVATELASNAIQHTASGRGAGFAVEITWQKSVVRVAVADSGGPAGPRVIDDPTGERGRGLLLVRGLSLRTGATGDHRGRLVWADIAWQEPPATSTTAHDTYQAAIRNGEAALARRFTGVPTWFGQSTLAWWALQTRTHWQQRRPELAGQLYELLESGDPSQPAAA